MKSVPYKILFFVAFFICSTDSFSQTDTVKTKKRKYTYYGGWGYNREAYTTSSIHFVNKGAGDRYPAYDFWVKDAKAHDKPDFDALPDVINFTIPQFSFRIGFWLNNKNDEGFELNYDHAKYVVTDGQTVHFKGTIAGRPVDQDSVIQKEYFHWEHTDGANFWQLAYMKRNRIWYSKNQFYKLSYVFKPCAGVVFPRTDATLFGTRLNNNWKVAGVMASLEISIRNEFCKHVYVELSGKSGWCDYMNCFVYGRNNGKASQNFGFIEGILIAGYQF